MRFRDIEHQERALSILRRALRSGRTHHAYLFDGPAGVGKELTARALAARLLCEKENLAPDADACGECSSCRMFATGNHPDFHLIHRGLHKNHPDRTVRASKGLFLVVDLIRHFLIEPAGMKPTQGRRRVFLIRDAERMNEEAQNALLKTLEEPPGEACLLLVTASAGRLLATIRSRCQRIPFALLPGTFIAERLQALRKASPADSAALAGLTGGRLGVALHWHKLGLLAALDPVGALIESLAERNPERFGKTLVQIATDVALRTRAADSSADGAEAAAEEMDDEASADEAGEEAAPARGASKGKTVGTDESREALKLTLLLIAALLRDAYLRRLQTPDLTHLPQQQERTTRLAALPLPRLEIALEAVQEAERMLDRNVAPQLMGERLAVALLGEITVLTPA